MRDDHERLRDILEAIDRIERYAARGKQAFETDELIQTWMVRNLQIIGEACGGLSRAFRSAHPAVPWSQIVGMRNIRRAESSARSLSGPVRRESMR